MGDHGWAVGFGVLFGGEFRQTEIENLDATIAADEQIVGLEVAVHDPFVVGSREALGDLYGVVDDLARRQESAVEHGAEAFALEKLGDEEWGTFVVSDVVDGQNVGMVQRGYRLRFLLEAAEAIGVAGEGFGQNLQSDVAVEARVAGAVDLPHSACADRRLNFVRAEPCAGA